MKIQILKTIELKKFMKIKAFDFEERKWVNAQIQSIDYDNQKVWIKASDGLEWHEDCLELSNKNSYRFED